MRVVTFLVLFKICLVLPAFTEANEPYNVGMACTSNTTAVISIDESHFKIFPPKNCSSMHRSSGNFTFGCLGDKNHFLVSPKLQKNNFRGGKGSKAFTISCVMKPDSSGAIFHLYANISVVEKFEKDSFGAPLQGIELLITSEDPSTATQPVTQILASSDIGQKLFLVIQSDQSIGSETSVSYEQLIEGEDFFLPLSCSAISERPMTVTANLWSNKSKNCIEDVSLIESFVVYKVGRQYGSSGSKYNLAYAPIYTFFLNDKEAEDVTYTCTVMVCPSTAASNTTCGKTMETMSGTKQCLSVRNGVSRRRRRAADEVTGESTRTLTATIRINNPSKLPIVPIVAGSVGAVVLIVLVNVIAVLLYRTRRDKKRKEVEKQDNEQRTTR